MIVRRSAHDHAETMGRLTEAVETRGRYAVGAHAATLEAMAQLLSALAGAAT